MESRINHTPRRHVAIASRSECAKSSAAEGQRQVGARGVEESSQPQVDGVEETKTPGMLVWITHRKRRAGRRSLVSPSCDGREAVPARGSLVHARWQR